MNDLISRQAAIDDILRRLDTLKMTEFGTGTFRDGVADGYARIISDLKSLPSAQTERKADGETISRQAAIDAIDRAVTKEAARWSLQELPSAERRGRWIKHPWGGGVHTCSVCGERAEIILTNGYLTGDASPSGETGGYFHYDRKELLSNYCPNCGARMEAEE